MDEEAGWEVWGGTESGGPAMVAAHSRRFESVFGNAEIPGALAIYTSGTGITRAKGQAYHQLH